MSTRIQNFKILFPKVEPRQFVKRILGMSGPFLTNTFFKPSHTYFFSFKSGSTRDSLSKKMAFECIIYALCFWTKSKSEGREFDTAKRHDDTYLYTFFYGFWSHSGYSIKHWNQYLTFPVCWLLTWKLRYSSLHSAWSRQNSVLKLEFTYSLVSSNFADLFFNP